MSKLRVRAFVNAGKHKLLYSFMVSTNLSAQKVIAKNPDWGMDDLSSHEISLLISEAIEEYRRNKEESVRYNPTVSDLGKKEIKVSRIESFRDMIVPMENFETIGDVKRGLAW
jgi:hypothetical protein